ncbi:MAG: DNA topoisomerase, partial [bacterium]
VLKEGFFKILPQEIEKYKIFKNTFVDCSERFLKIINYEIDENYTKPPSRYTISSIIKKMEEVGIGRPSTYSSTIETLKKRKYIQVKKGVIVVTELGKKVLEFLDKGYSDLLDVEFTALMENFLDEIEASDVDKAKKFCYQKILEIYRRLRN